MCFATATTQALPQIEEGVSGVCALVSRTKKALCSTRKPCKIPRLMLQWQADAQRLFG